MMKLVSNNTDNVGDDGSGSVGDDWSDPGYEDY